MTTSTTSIERSIEIAATAATVWSIVSEPGWWVNDGTITEHEITDLGDGTVRVTDPTHGPFVISTVTLQEPRYAAFRWHPAGPEESATLTEFRIVDREGGVTLSVVESGFDELTAEQRDDVLRDNASGWETELRAARTLAESRAGSA